MTAGSADLAVKVQIEAERIRLFYRQLHLAVAFTVFALALIAVTLWHDQSSRTALLGWIAVMLAIQAGRFALALAFQRARPAPEAIGRWRRYAIIAGGAVGLGWAGSAFLVFRPEDPFHMMIMLATAAGVVGGGAAIMTALPEAYYAYAGLHVSALALTLANLGRPETNALAVGTLTFGVLMLAITRIGKATMEESLRLRYERIGMIEHLEEARVQAESASKAKSEFLTLMTHELRTPLNSIIGYAELISGLPPSKRGDDLDAYTKDIREGAHNLLALINDILDLTKADSGKLVVQERLFAVPVALERCRRSVQTHAEHRRIELSIEVPDGLPALRGDERLISHAILNLIANAIKFSPPGACVRIGASHTEAGEIAIEIADEGIGMAAEDIPRALEPFQQLDHGLKREREGSGLGLPLAKRFTEIHGGRIEISSQPGQGTAVRLVMPADRVVS